MAAWALSWGGPACAAAPCEGEPQPLLWEATRGVERALLLAGHQEALASVQPLPPAVLEAVRCAEVAYFGVACTPGDAGGLGHFYEHCKNYPISNVRDSIALRLPKPLLKRLQKALFAAAGAAPAACVAAAGELWKTAQRLTSPDFRRSLRFVYLQALAVLDEARCTVDPMSPGASAAPGGGYTGWLRQRLAAAGRPVFGLLDPMSNCDLIQATTIHQDERLAASMARTLADAAWRAAHARNGRSFAEAAMCGDLQQLTSFAHRLHVDLRGHRNAEVARLIAAAMAAHRNATLLVVVPIHHLIDTGKTEGTLKLLTKAGYSLVRLSRSSNLTCTEPSFAGPGARDLGACLAPPGKEQPDSCKKFDAFMQRKLAADPMYGRNSTGEHCARCLNSDEACACAFKWSNTTAFNRMCEETVVDGVRGRVLAVDLTRNPGSSRPGPGLSEKTLLASRVRCHAETCSVPLLQDVATRHWYSTDPDLSAGLVSLRPLSWRGKTASFLPASSLWAVVVATALIVGALVACFFAPKARKARSTRRAALDPSPVEGGGDYDPALLREAMGLAQGLQDAVRPALALLQAGALAEPDSDDTEGPSEGRGPPLVPPAPWGFARAPAHGHFAYQPGQPGSPQAAYQQLRHAGMSPYTGN